MKKNIYIALGNHRSFAGIKEIVYTLRSALSDQFSVELSRELKGNSVNIIIDEFSGLFDVDAIKQVTERFPNTKIVIVATEFATPVCILGVELFRMFNFFGTPWDWGRLLRDTLRSAVVGMPPYMRRRYFGFVHALAYCNLLTTIHPRIVPMVAELAKAVAPALATPLLVYPQIGPLSEIQQNRLASLPVGFAMTGTQTPYRTNVLRGLVRKFRRAGWHTPLYEHHSFEAPNSAGSLRRGAYQSETLATLLEYSSISPKVLFNVNPPQSAKWAYSSPMRILRAVLLGQIPVITRRFHDHPLEDVARLWDGRMETVIDLASWQFVDRRIWLADYLRSVEAYDQEAKEINKQFVSAVKVLVDDLAPAPYWTQQRSQTQDQRGPA